MSTLVLRLPYPISGNDYWAHRCYYDKKTRAYRAVTHRTHEANAYIDECRWIAKKAGIYQPLSGRLVVGYRLYPHRPQDWATRQRKLGEWWDDGVRCIDLGNAEKVVSDAMQGLLYADDAQFRKLVLERMEPDANGARLMAFIQRVERAQLTLLASPPLRDVVISAHV